MINQCDGCQSNQSKISGVHYDHDGIPTMVCESEKYGAPTHYAVVDEYGEIVYARRICATLDAEAQCKHYIKLCDKDPVTRNDALNWTIKGVTVNE